MAAAGAIYGAPTLGVGTASSVLQAPLFGSIVNVQKLLIVKSSIDFVVNASHGEYANAAIAAADIFSPVPIGLTVKAAKGVERTCEGNL
ncbi:hypothetical protein [Leptospira adleri]|nr:hypothetical protein [Leptospira adleri]